MYRYFKMKYVKHPKLHTSGTASKYHTVKPIWAFRWNGMYWAIWKRVCGMANSLV